MDVAVIIKILVAIFGAGIFGQLVVQPIDKLLKELRKNKEVDNEGGARIKSEHGKIIAILIGIFERTISALAWFGGQPNFIGFWFAGKVIGNWERRKSEDEGVFSSFLLTTGISILFAISVAVVTNWILNFISIKK